MGECPFHSGGGSEADGNGTDATAEGPSGDRGHVEDEQGTGGGGRSGLERRSFVKSALLIGGTSALSGLGSVAGISTSARAEGEPRITAEARLNRQHAWDAYEPVAPTGNTAQPPNSIILLLDYAGDGEPSAGHRRRVEAALSSIEDEFAWHAGGVLFTMAYSASYFDRFDEDPPAGARPDDGETVAETAEELTAFEDANDDIAPDEHDAALLLSSENVANLLAVEAALWGEGDLDFDGTFEGVFERPTEWPARRVGFAGPEFQANEADYEERFLEDDQEVPDEAPLSMGHVAGFGQSIPDEEKVTLKAGQEFPSPTVDEDDVPDLEYVGDVGERDPGVFAQGTLKHLSHVDLDLSEWYDVDSDTQRQQMYSPYHTEDETNAKGGDKPGSGLTTDDDTRQDGPDQEDLSTREFADRVPETATGDDDAETDTPTAGHSQKAARARYDVDGDGEPEQPVLRRDWDAITPTGEDGADAAGYIFNVPMRFNESIYTLLDANYNVGFTSLDGDIDHGPAENETVKERNGISPFMDVLRRANWLVPPVTVRSLPYPRAADADVGVEARGDTVAVTVEDVDADGALDPETVRFGATEAVNRAGGASPTGRSRKGGTLTFEFDADAVDLDGEAKLFAKTQGTREPVVGTTEA